MTPAAPPVDRSGGFPPRLPRRAPRGTRNRARPAPDDPPDDKEGGTRVPARPAMMALALGGCGIGTTEFGAMGLLPQIADGMGVSEPTAGHVISAYALGVVVGAPTISALTARVDRRRLLVILMAAFTLGNAVTVLAPSMNVLIGSRFVAGLPHGAYF